MTAARIDALLAPHVADEDVREYVRGTVDAWDEDADEGEFRDVLMPLLLDAGVEDGEADDVAAALWALVAECRGGAGDTTTTFAPLEQGPLLLDSINRIQLHPHDEIKLKQGSKTITEMSETFTVSSEKDLARLEKLEKKHKEKQMAAYVQHKKQVWVVAWLLGIFLCVRACECMCECVCCAR